MITSWGRWGFWTAYSILMSVGPITRIRDGRGDTLDAVAVTVLGACFLYGLILLVMTLFAYRRDPSLRKRKWSSPSQALRLSRQVTRSAALLAILALGLVLLVYAGWGPALFVTVILGGAAIAIERLGLVTDSAPPVEPNSEFPQSDRNTAPPDE